MIIDLFDLLNFDVWLKWCGVCLGWKICSVWFGNGWLEGGGESVVDVEGWVWVGDGVGWMYESVWY